MSVNTSVQARPGALVIRAPRVTRPITRAWFARDALALARALIGCYLVYERGLADDPRDPHERHRGSPGARPSGPTRIARIVETEAYRGPKDLACHARAGLTTRTRTLLGVEGRAYVFLVYGMHDCFNVTCGGLGRGHAVLVRAGEPVEGFEHHVRLDGPGRLARAMGISRATDGHDLSSPPLYICGRTGRPRIGVSARVGVGYAGVWADKPWRFFDAASRHVSRPPRKSIGRGRIP